MSINNCKYYDIFTINIFRFETIYYKSNDYYLMTIAYIIDWVSKIYIREHTNILS